MEGRCERGEQLTLPNDHLQAQTTDTAVKTSYATTHRFWPSATAASLQRTLTTGCSQRRGPQGQYIIHPELLLLGTAQHPVQAPDFEVTLGGAALQLQVQIAALVAQTSCPRVIHRSLIAYFLKEETETRSYSDAAPWFPVQWA